MSEEPSQLTLGVTKPKSRPARLLADMGVRLVPVAEGEGEVDRYIVIPRVAIERRSASGFLMGIMDKTLFTSAIYLREHYRVPILIIEGQVDYTYRGFDPQAVRGAIGSMMLEYGLTVLSTPTLEETVAQVAMIARQEQVGIPEISLAPKRKAADLPDMQRRLVEMLPGCGRVMARDLLQHFGSVQRVLGASADELCELRGIGARKAKQMHQVLHAEYRAVDTERHLEDAIVEAPALLFEQPVQALARQHHIFTEDKDKHIVDLVFLDTEADELVLVELKRGRLAREHERQLRRYLDHAPESRLLRPFLERGTRVRGVLATVEQSEFEAKDPDVSVCFVDEKRVVDVLSQRRARRLAVRDDG